MRLARPSQPDKSLGFHMEKSASAGTGVPAAIYDDDIVKKFAIATLIWGAVGMLVVTFAGWSRLLAGGGGLLTGAPLPAGQFPARGMQTNESLMEEKANQEVADLYQNGRVGQRRYHPRSGFRRHHHPRPRA